MVLGIVSNTVREIGSSLSANKAVLGVQFALDSDEPILDVITPKGPAEKAGIKKGDLILSVNGKVAKTREKIQSMLKPMKPGDKVMVPRTGGGYSLGEILEVYVDRARVTFPIGTTFRGKPRPLVGMGYKTVKLSELRPVKEVSNSDY